MKNLFLAVFLLAGISAIAQQDLAKPFDCNKDYSKYPLVVVENNPPVNDTIRFKIVEGVSAEGLEIFIVWVTSTLRQPEEKYFLHIRNDEMNGGIVDILPLSGDTPLPLIRTKCDALRAVYDYKHRDEIIKKKVNWKKP